jgi:hypothetical protein
MGNYQYDLKKEKEQPDVQQTLAKLVTVKPDNPDRNMKNEKFCSQLSTYKISKIGLSWMKETLDFSF